MAGPLAGLRIIEMAGIGPGPFCGMMLADQGAEVIRVERPFVRGFAFAQPELDVLSRSRKSVVLDVKTSDGLAAVRDLVRTADGLIEGYRPGVMERLGLGPAVLLEDNPRLVYGRMTGWGQDGPYASAAGHDINYIALAGALDSFGRRGQKPTPPVNMVGDFGGGGMMLAFGMLAGIMSARTTGKGQVVDCAMVDGSAILMAMVWGMHAMGLWRQERGTNELDTAAHYYETYETADGKFISLGSIEPQFYAELLRLTDLDGDEAFAKQTDPAMWDQLKARLTTVIRAKTRDEWCAIMEGTDVCFAPVLSLDDAPLHPHNTARETFVQVGGHLQPAPAPRFSGTPSERPRPTPPIGVDTVAVLRELGYDEPRIARLAAGLRT